MLTEPACDRISGALLQARDTGTLAPLPSATEAGFTLDDGYRIGHALHERLCARGYSPVGRKIGFTNPATWAQFNLSAPIWGPVYDRTIHLADRVACALALSGMVAPRIETEIVLKLWRVPASGDLPVEELAACIEWAAVGFEVVDSHYPEWRFTPADAVADFGVHGALIVGKPWLLAKEDPRQVAATLPALRVTQLRDGQVVTTGEGRNVLGSPLLSLAQLVRMLAAQPWAAPLVAGEIITTGTMTPVAPIAPGQRWRAEVSGAPLPALELIL
jgi:2-oxo-3-hexenedioate decarboxylase